MECPLDGVSHIPPTPPHVNRHIKAKTGNSVNSVAFCPTYLEILKLCKLIFVIIIFKL